MINFLTGDLLSTGAEVLIKTVNPNGVMGKGIALQFKETYPENFKIYTVACKTKGIEANFTNSISKNRLPF